MNIELAHAIARSRWIRSPWVWMRVGAESEYLDWLSGQACCCCGGRTDVRGLTVVAPMPAGPHSRLEPSAAFPWAPVCRPCVLLWHTQGPEALRRRAIGPKAGERTAQQWLAHQRTECAASWAYHRLPQVLGAKDWTGLSRKRLTAWALGGGLYEGLASAMGVEPVGREERA